MPIGPNLLWSACRVTSEGRLRGTAFIVGVRSELHPKQQWPFLVTAHHVIRNQLEVAVEVPDRSTGELLTPFEVNDWWQPLDDVDLVIAPYQPDDGRPEPRAVVMDLQALKPGQSPMLGMTIYYIGIFQGRETPMVRSGVLGTPPITIQKSDPEYTYDANLVDCRSYGGFSGSPCYVELLHPVLNSEIPPFGPFVPNDQPDLTKGEEPKLGILHSFVPLTGMFTAHFTDEKDTETNPSELVSRYGVGVMLPVSYIWEALMSEDALNHRRYMDVVLTAQHAAKHAEASDASVPDPEPQPDEF